MAIIIDNLRRAKAPETNTSLIAIFKATISYKDSLLVIPKMELHKNGNTFYAEEPHMRFFSKEQPDELIQIPHFLLDIDSKNKILIAAKPFYDNLFKAEQSLAEEVADKIKENAQKEKERKQAEKEAAKKAQSKILFDELDPSSYENLFEDQDG